MGATAKMDWRLHRSCECREDGFAPLKPGGHDAPINPLENANFCQFNKFLFAPHPTRGPQVAPGAHQKRRWLSGNPFGMKYHQKPVKINPSRKPTTGRNPKNRDPTSQSFILTCAISARHRSRPLFDRIPPCSDALHCCLYNQRWNQRRGM